MRGSETEQNNGGGHCHFSSVDTEEVNKFNGVEWWDTKKGGMRPLLSYNKIRVPFIRDGLLQGMGRSVPAHCLKDGENGKILEGIKILDIGSGGGILSEGLGKLGATVVGIEPGSENVTIARNHLPIELRSNVTYYCTTIEEYATQQEEGHFDAVVMSEVVEHVENPKEFIKTAVKLVKPGGSVFITCPNRTVASWLGAVLMAEYVLRILPVGTHSWKKFLTPEEIQDVLHSCGLKTVKIKGITFNPITYVWDFTRMTQVHYALQAFKPK